MYVTFGGVLDAVWSARGNFVEIGGCGRSVCHGIPPATVTKPGRQAGTSSRLLEGGSTGRSGGTRLMPVECYARDRKIRDGVGGTELG